MGDPISHSCAQRYDHLLSTLAAHHNKRFRGEDASVWKSDGWLGPHDTDTVIPKSPSEKYPGVCSNMCVSGTQISQVDLTLGDDSVGFGFAALEISQHSRFATSVEYPYAMILHDRASRRESSV